MRISRGARLLAGGAALSLVLAACGGTGEVGGGEGGQQEPVVVHIVEPQNPLIPQNTAETQGSLVLSSLFAPLIEIDENMQPVEKVAETVSSEDNQKWTIKLKDGWTFHDGSKVTAQSFADAWNWAANQENAAEGNNFFDAIEGWEDLNPGEGKKPKTDEMSGLKVVDDLTLEVQLSRPVSAFKKMLGYTSFYPLPEAAFDDKGQITEEFQEAPIGNGAYKMDGSWKKGTDQEIKQTQYDKYPGEKGEVKDIVYKIYNDDKTAFNDLQAGNVDFMPQVGGTNKAAAQAFNPDGFYEGPDTGISYLGVPLHEKVGDKYGKQQNDAAIRKAISKAIDRKTIGEKQLAGTRFPADDFIAPIIPAYREGACDACVYDPEAAKKEYKEAGGPKELDIYTNTDTPGNREWMQAVANSIQKSLGEDLVKVNFKPVAQFAKLLDDLENKKIDGLWRSGWLADYPDAENYLKKVFGTKGIGGSNYSFYSNKEFDDLIDKGDAATDPEEAVKFYQQADDLLNRDMPYIPIHFYKRTAVSSKDITGAEMDFYMHIRWEKVKYAN